MSAGQWIDEVFIIPDASYPYPQKLIDQISETGVTVHLNTGESGRYAWKETND